MGLQPTGPHSKLDRPAVCGVAVALALIFWTFVANASPKVLDQRFQSTEIYVGSRPVKAYLADNDQKRAKGLMGVTKLPEHAGVLFVFDEAQYLSFWMKNTLIPLAIGFFDSAGVLVDVQEMQPPASVVTLQVPTYQSRALAQFALEMNAGWYRKNKISSGAKLFRVKSAKSKVFDQQIPKK